MNASDGSKVRSIQTSEMYTYNNYADTAISDDDSTLYISARDSSENGYLCTYNVR